MKRLLSDYKFSSAVHVIMSRCYCVKHLKGIDMKLLLVPFLEGETVLQNIGPVAERQAGRQTCRMT
jgi:hypothetical protein